MGTRRPGRICSCCLETLVILSCIPASGACMSTLPTPSVVRLTPRLPRPANDTMSSPSQPPPTTPTAANGSTFLTTQAPIASPSPSSPVSLLASSAIPSMTPSTTQTLSPTSLALPTSHILASATSSVFLSGSLTAFTTSVPITVFNPLTTFTSSSAALVIATRIVTAFPDISTVQANVVLQPICIGHGVDAASLGLFSTLIIPSLVGLLIWVTLQAPTCCGGPVLTRPQTLFAFLRPRYRQVYGLREWFVQQRCAPHPFMRIGPGINASKLPTETARPLLLGIPLPPCSPRSIPSLRRLQRSAIAHERHAPLSF